MLGACARRYEDGDTLLSARDHAGAGPAGSKERSLAKIRATGAPSFSSAAKSGASQASFSYRTAIGSTCSPRSGCGIKSDATARNSRRRHVDRNSVHCARPASVPSAQVATALDFGPFLALAEASRARLLGGSERATFAAGSALVREGEQPDVVLAVIAGRLRVAQGDQPKILATLAAPALVGEMALLSGEPRNATVTALTQARAFRIPASLFREVIATEPEFARQLAAFAGIRAGNNFLRRSSPFADLPAAAIEALAAKLEPAAFAAGEILMREGERGDDAYLVRSGDLEVLRAERLLATIGPGSFVGEVSALTGTARTATVRADTEV